MLAMTVHHRLAKQDDIPSVSRVFAEAGDDLDQIVNEASSLNLHADSRNANFPAHCQAKSKDA